VPLAGGAALLLAVLGSLLAVAWYERGLDERYALERSELLAHVLADSATRQVEATALAVATLSELLASGLGPEGPEMRAAMAQTLVNLPFLRGIGVVDSRAECWAAAHQKRWVYASGSTRWAHGLLKGATGSGRWCPRVAWLTSARTPSRQRHLQAWVFCRLGAPWRCAAGSRCWWWRKSIRRLSPLFSRFC